MTTATINPKQLNSTQLETIKYLKPAQLTSLLAAARKHSVRDYTILLTAYTHALRITEVGRLQLQDYDTSTHRLRMRRVKKGHSPSYLTSEEAHKALTQWLKIRGPLSGPLFCSRRSKLGRETQPTELVKGISKRMLHNIFVKYATLANLPEDLRHFHVLRHSCAVHMVDKKIPLVQIQDWLGHKNIASTIVYAKVSDMARDDTARIFHDEMDGMTASMRIAGSTGYAKQGIQWQKDKKK